MPYPLIDDDKYWFSLPSSPPPPTYSAKTLWNGRSVQPLQAQPYCFVQEILAFAEGGDCQALEGEWEVLLIGGEAEDIDVFEEEEPEWEIATPYVYAPNSDENATVEEILARAGWSFDNGQRAEVIPCKSLKKHVKGIKKGLKKTGKKCADFIAKHKKGFLIGAGVVAAATGIAILIAAAASAGTAATTGIAAGAGALAKGAPSRRKNEEGDAPASSSPNPEKDREPSPRKTLTNTPSFQLAKDQSSQIDKPLLPSILTAYKPIDGTYSPMKGLVPLPVNQPSVPHEITRSKSQDLRNESRFPTANPPKPYEMTLSPTMRPLSNLLLSRDPMFLENAREGMLFPPHIDCTLPLKMDGEPHIMTSIVDVVSIPRSGVGLIPVKGLSPNNETDWVVIKADWTKMHVTSREMINGTVCIDDHFRDYMPTEGTKISLVSPKNGINVTSKEFLAMAENIHAKIPEGPLILGLYNPTHGLVVDGGRALKEISGKQTRISETSRQFLAVIVKRGEEVNKEFHFLTTLHSEAGAIQRRAFEHMSDELKTMIREHQHVIALGPALPISKLEAFEALNIYSKKDYITMWFAIKYLNDPNYDIKIVPCMSSWDEKTLYFADHASDGTTYDTALKNALDKEREDWGFYDGNAP